MSAGVFTHDMFGHPTDFELKTERQGDKNLVTVTTVMPHIALRDGILVSFPPPRYPWANAAEASPSLSGAKGSK